MMADESTLWSSTRQSLMLGIQDARNETAWATFLDIYFPIVYRYCRLRKLQEADARDVTQDVMVRVRRYIKNYRREKGRFRGWLARVARNEIARHFARSNRDRAHGSVGCDDGEVEIEALEDHPDLDWERIFTAHLLEAALTRVTAEFNDKQWEAFEQVAYRLEQTSEGRALVRIDEPQYLDVARAL
jgi:RNA polymerase sigma factor (sigma-70 family)